jgi:polygalacturonase
MNLKLRNIVLIITIASSFAAEAKSQYKYDYLYNNLAFKMEKVQMPVFPDRKVSIINYGAVGDGVYLNTDAFNNAMTDLSKKGGGTLVIPSGVWFTGPIVFQSNINLHLEKGALILFTPDFNAYPMVKTVFEGLETRRCQSPISGRNLENIAITGEGAINGSGEAWRPLKKAKVTEAHWKSVVSSGGVLLNPGYWFPSEKSLKGAKLSEENFNVPKKEMSEADWDSIKDFLRPVMISFMQCNKVMLEGVLFENSPGWNVHPFMCENVILDGVFVRNPAYAQNGDGLDLESCKNALVVNSTFDVGDDAICLKSGKGEEGRRRGVPTENVIVDNCKVFKGHGGFVVGSEMSGGVRNISVSNCLFMGTDVGLRFKSNRGRGGVVENIYVDGISMFDIVTDSFLFDLYYGGKSASESLEDGDVTPAESLTPAVSEKTPVFRNIFVKNLVSRNARRAMFFNGLPEMNIKNIVVEKTSISSRFGAELSESDGIEFRDVVIYPAEGSPLKLNNVKNMVVRSAVNTDNSKATVEIAGSSTKGIVLPQATKVMMNGVSENVVSFKK